MNENLKRVCMEIWSNAYNKYNEMRSNNKHNNNKINININTNKVF